MKKSRVSFFTPMIIVAVFGIVSIAAGEAADKPMLSAQIPITAKCTAKGGSPIELKNITIKVGDNRKEGLDARQGLLAIKLDILKIKHISFSVGNLIDDSFLKAVVTSRNNTSQEMEVRIKENNSPIEVHGVSDFGSAHLNIEDCKEIDFERVYVPTKQKATVGC